MNKNVSMFGFAAALAMTLAVGCASDPHGKAKYLPGGEVISGSPNAVTVYDLDTAVKNLMSRMRAHPMFVRNYELIKTEKGEKPLLQVLPIDCRCPSSSFARGRLNVLRDRVCQSVFESDLFALRDAVMSEALQDAEVPDCVLRGSLAGFRERSGCYVYRLQLVLTDPKTTAVLWQGSDTFLKVD